MRSFTISGKSSHQEGNEHKHLLTRALNGLSSDRYKKADYKAFEEFSKKEKSKSKHAELKMKALSETISIRKETDFMKKQNEIWSKSFTNLASEIYKAEEVLSDETKSFLNVIRMLDEDDFIEFDNHIKQIEDSMESYEENIVEPLRCLKVDLQYKIDENKSEGANEVYKILEDTKYKATVVLQQIIDETNTLQTDVDEWISYQHVNKEMFQDKHLEEIFSGEVLEMFEEFGVGDMFQNQLNHLCQEHGEKFDHYKTEIDRIKSKLEASLWSQKEQMILRTLMDVYHQYTPEYLRKKTNSLQLDMLYRLLPKKSKLQVLEAECHENKLRYFNKRMNSLHEELNTQVLNVRNRAISTLFETAENMRIDNLKKLTRNQQIELCDQLHQEVQQMRAKKAEIQRLEDLLEKEKRRELKEQKRREMEVEKKRRNKISSQINDFQRRKAAQKERERLALETQLMKLKEELKEQAKIDRERVKHREEMYLQKLENLNEMRLEREQEEVEKQKRLEALAKTVAPVVEADPARMVQNTFAYNAKFYSIGTNQDINLQAPLFTTHGFSDIKIKSDPRIRVERELRKLNLHGTDYGREIISKMTPPTKPRPDTFSTGFQNATFSQNDTSNNF